MSGASFVHCPDCGRLMLGNAGHAQPHECAGVTRDECPIWWGSHGCVLDRGHDGPHACDCCECDDHARDHEAEGCVALPPYYGPDTNFGNLDTPATPPEGASL